MIEKIKALPRKTLSRTGILLLIITVGSEEIVSGSVALTIMQGMFLVVGLLLLMMATDKKKAEKALEAKEESTGKSIAKKAKVRR